MDNVTIIENPQVNSSVIVSTNGTMLDAKAAKLDNVKKRPNLQNFYQRELNKLRSTNMPFTQNVTLNQNMSNPFSRLNIEAVNYTPMVMSDGARKLKVSKVNVASPVLAKFNLAKKTIPVSKVEEELPKEIVPPVIHEEKKINEPMVSDTRVSRLEKTGEIPMVNSMQNTPVINAPERFTQFYQNENVNSLPSRTERQTFTQDNSKSMSVTEIGKEARNLDQISTLMHKNENEGNDLSMKIQDAHKRLEDAVRENRRVVTQSANIEEQIRDVRATVEKLKKDKVAAQQRELDKTLNMIEVTNEENLGATRKLTNLQAELAELIKQRDEMMNDSSYLGRRSM